MPRPAKESAEQGGEGKREAFTIPESWRFEHSFNPPPTREEIHAELEKIIGVPPGYLGSPAHKAVEWHKSRARLALADEHWKQEGLKAGSDAKGKVEPGAR